MTDKKIKDNNLEQILGSQQAKQFDELLYAGQRFFDEQPAGVPDPAALENIRNRVREALSVKQKQCMLRKRVFAAVAVAASLAIATLFSLYALWIPVEKTATFTADTAGQNQMWQSGSLDSDAIYAYAQAEFEYIEQQLENGHDAFSTEQQDELTQLEVELTNFENEFWKG